MTSFIRALMTSNGKEGARADRWKGAHFGTTKEKKDCRVVYLKNENRPRIYRNVYMRTRTFLYRIMDLLDKSPVRGYLVREIEVQ